MEEEHEQLNEEWYSELERELPYASTEVLKAMLEHTSKLVDQLAIANESINQKARWGIGIIVAIFAVLLKEALSADNSSTQWTNLLIYSPVSTGLLVAFFIYAHILMANIIDTSGIEPRRNYHGQLIAFSREIKELGDYAGSSENLDYGQFVLDTLYDYQQRIERSWSSNQKLSSSFRRGSYFLIGSLAAWGITYFILNAVLPLIDRA